LRKPVGSSTGLLLNRARVFGASAEERTELQLEKARGEQHWPLVQCRPCLWGISRREKRSQSLRRFIGRSTGLWYNGGRVFGTSADERSFQPEKARGEQHWPLVHLSCVFEESAEERTELPT
jgi:hypothetical protein